MKFITFIKKVLAKLTPQSKKYVYDVYALCVILIEQYGFLKSVKAKLPINAEGAPIPWYTYPAIEYISQLDLSNKKIFEYGVGHSSLFFANRAKYVTSVEDNKEWFEKIEKQKPNNLNIIYEAEKDAYIQSIAKQNTLFDIIVIDASHRFDCCTYVKNFLAPGGFIILDNSDWCQKEANYLRNELDLIQVDFCGFGPINTWSWVTSIFMQRDFNFSTASKTQPQKPLGGTIWHL